MDIEYNTDEYYDSPVGAIGKEEATQAGQKRRRTNGSEPGHGKRRKVSSAKAVRAKHHGPPPLVPVVWLSLLETSRMKVAARPYTKTTPYALLSDWRLRFKDSSGFHTAIAKEGVGKDDIESQDEDMDNEVEADDDDDDGDDEDGESQDEGAGVEPALIMEALKAKLSDSGLGGVEQGKFMEAIMGMMAGGEGGNIEDMLGELTSSLLSRASEEGAGSGAAQWLTQQGVSLPGDDEDVEESANDRTQTEHAESMSKLQAPRNRADQSIPEQKTEEEEDVPDSANRVDARVLKDLEVTQNSTADAENRTGAKDKETKSTKPSRSTSRPSTGKKASLVGTGATNDHGGTEASSAQEKTGATNGTKSSEPALAKTTTQPRKRKAPAEEPTTVTEKAKRQQRSFAAPTASSQNKAAESSKRATRSTRQSKK